MFLRITFLFAPSATASAEIYKWTDANGQVHFGDKPRAAAKVVNVQVNTYQPVRPLPARPAAGKQVVMYGASWCRYCAEARAYFHANRVSFTEYDVDKDAAANRTFQQLSGKGLPLILVGGKRLEGFSADSFRAVYP